MKLIKFEKVNCGPCTSVSNWLNDAGVEFEVYNPFESEKGAELAAKYQIGFTVPVTVLVDENEEKVELVRGFDVPGLETLVAKLSA